MEIVTHRPPDGVGEVIRYVQNPSHPFDPICLDIRALVRGGLVEGEASAGRGNTVFFTLQNEQLVLRHYRRGGLVRHISKTHYLFVGMRRTRAMLEFGMLLSLQKEGLPAPRPYACRVLRQGLLYTASLVTYRLPGSTLAERLIADGCLSTDKVIEENLWRSLGRLIARFHVAGVYHADLNAHNIMLHDDAGMALIDFDRGRMRDLPKNPAQGGWCLENMHRLGRSLNKIALSAPMNELNASTVSQKFRWCTEQWSQCVSS